MPGHSPELAPREPHSGDGRGLRVAILVYRGNPRSGGQGVYTKYLSRELARLGHEVTVFSGQPWPDLGAEAGVKLVKVPSLDLYRDPDPFRLPRPAEVRSWPDLVEVATMLTGGFPEPRTFSMRAKRALSRQVPGASFDIVHDNGSFGTGLLGLARRGWPVVGTCHHPVTVDRLIDLGEAEAFGRRLSLLRWYGFVRMQAAVARRLPKVLTVSATSRRDIVEQMGVAPERVAVVPIGADADLFRPPPRGYIGRVPGRVMTTTSADVPMKGLGHLMEAVAKLRAEQPEAHLFVVGKPRPDGPAASAVERLGLEGAVTFIPRVSDEELVRLYSQATVVAVPSLYEGFSLPAIEAMSCEVPVVATSSGALPEVLGRDGEAALFVPPGDPGALAQALATVLSAPQSFRRRLGRAGRQRVLGHYTWRRCAERTVEQYRSVLEGGAGRPGQGRRAGA
jgi:glycosyltransferase involved in cell wall biosynthesis